MLLHYVTIFRHLWLAGRFGGGKTSLAVSLAFQLVQGGYARRIATNTPLRIEAKSVTVVDKSELGHLTDCVVLLDEAWLELGHGAAPAKVKEWFAYMRKNNQYLLMPSVLPLVRQASIFRVDRQFNGLVFGAPVWLYRWSLNTGDRKSNDSGRYLWWFPQRIFGSYDHEARPGQDYYIYNWD